jgi:D-glycero-D-manno-heptose 1,7-bisphosphate phosphatase
MKRPAVFLDRDGTLIEEVNYLHRVEDLRIFPATETSLKKLKDAGYLLIVVTNQSGIGREVYGESDMHDIHEAMQKQLDGVIDAFYFCPHLPCDGCRCRKPELGMIEFATADFEIDLTNSWMVGDKKIDVETGFAAKLQTALVLTGYGASHQASLQEQPDVIVEDIGRAVEAIIEISSGQNRPQA